MSKNQKTRNEPLELFQANLPSALAKRFRRTAEFKLYGKKGTALVDLLERVLRGRRKRRANIAS